MDPAEPECAVCLARPPNCALACGHDMCVSCLTQLAAPPKCPLCRAPIASRPIVLARYGQVGEANAALDAMYPAAPTAQAAQAAPVQLTPYDINFLAGRECRLWTQASSETYAALAALSTDDAVLAMRRYVFDVDPGNGRITPFTDDARWGFRPFPTPCRIVLHSPTVSIPNTRLMPYMRVYVLVGDFLAASVHALESRVPNVRSELRGNTLAVHESYCRFDIAFPVAVIECHGAEIDGFTHQATLRWHLVYRA